MSWKKIGKEAVEVYFILWKRFQDIKKYMTNIKLKKYREQCQRDAIDMLKEYFFDLWD